MNNLHFTHRFGAILKATFVCLFMIFNILLFAQTSSNIKWEKTIGGAGIDEIQSIKQISDGGYIAVGYTGSKGNGGLDIWLIELDKNGNTRWDKTYGGRYDEKAYSIQQTTDGGYIITGYTASFGVESWDVWLIKTDENGTEEWNRTYGGSSFDIGYSVIQTSDGGFLIGGQRYSAGNQDDSDGWIIKTDANGNVLWNKLYGKAGHDFLFDIQVTSDNKYIFTGSSDPQITPSNFRDLWLLKTNLNGDLEWNKTFDGNNNKDFGHEVQETSDGGFIVTGNKRHVDGKREIWLIKTDANGNQMWNKVLSEGKDALSRSIQPTSDGGYIISGFIDYNSTGDMDFCLIKLNQNFDKEWLQRFGKSTQIEEAQSAYQTTDGGYIIAGFTTISENNTDFYIVKTDDKGNITSSVALIEQANINLCNYPNPFKQNTTIKFSLKKKSKIKLTIHNSLGQEIEVIENRTLPTGTYSYMYSSRKNNSGIHYYCLETNNTKFIKKMIISK